MQITRVQKVSSPHETTPLERNHVGEASFSSTLKPSTSPQGRHCQAVYTCFMRCGSAQPVGNSRQLSRPAKILCCYGQAVNGLSVSSVPSMGVEWRCKSSERAG